MKYFAVFSAVVSCSLAAPVAEAEADPQLLLAKPYINSGSASGPLTPLVGDLVATNRGYASLSLEGFSEDVNQDGFVDPIAHVAPVVAAAAPVVAAAPAVTYVHNLVAPTFTPSLPVAAVKKVEVVAPEVKVEKVEVPAPVVTYAAAPAVH